MNHYLNRAVPIVVTSVLHFMGTVFTLRAVSGTGIDNLAILSLYAPIAYLVLAIQEGMRAPALAMSARGTSFGNGERLSEILSVICIIIVVVHIAVSGLSFLAFLLFQEISNSSPYIDVFLFTSMMTIGAIPAAINGIVLVSLFGLNRSRAGMIIGTVEPLILGVSVWLLCEYTGLGLYSLPLTAGFLGIAGTYICLEVLKRNDDIKLSLPSLAAIRSSKELFQTTSLPTILTFVVVGIVLYFINHLLSESGPIELAGFGVAWRIHSFLMVPAFAIGTATAIAVNSAWQSSEFESAKKNVVIGVLVIVGLYTVVSYLLYSFSHELGYALTGSEDVGDVVAQFFGSVGMVYPIFCACLMVMAVMEQSGLGPLAFMFNLVAGILQILSIYMAFNLYGTSQAMFIALAGCQLVAGLVVVGWALISKWSDDPIGEFSHAR